MLLLEQKWFENGTCVNGHKKNVTLCCKYLKAMTLILQKMYNIYKNTNGAEKRTTKCIVGLLFYMCYYRKKLVIFSRNLLC